MFPLYKKKIIFHLLFCYIIKYELLSEKEKLLTAAIDCYQLLLTRATLCNKLQ